MVKFISLLISLWFLKTSAFAVEFVPNETQYQHHFSGSSQSLIVDKKQVVDLARQRLFESTADLNEGTRREVNLKGNLKLNGRFLHQDILIAAFFDDLDWLHDLSPEDFESPVVVIIGGTPEYLLEIQSIHPNWPIHSVAGLGQLEERGLNTLPALIHHTGEVITFE